MSQLPDPESHSLGSLGSSSPMGVGCIRALFFESDSKAAEKQIAGEDDAKRCPGSFDCSVSSYDSIPSLHNQQRYKISDQQLGVGCEATIFEGEDVITRTKIAVKVFPKNGLKSETEILLESQILQICAHRNVIGYIDLLEDPNSFNMFLEYAPGGDLLNRLTKENHKYTEVEARSLFRNLVEAIHFIHSMDIVHRDIKPENILLMSSTDHCDMRVNDFGCATICYDDSLTDLIGTFQYMAPEVLKRSPYGKRVDLWMLGVLLYIVLSGGYPFSHCNDKVKLKRIVSAKYSLESSRWVIDRYPTSHEYSHCRWLL